MITLVKNLNCMSRLNIHYYPNRWYKSYIILGKSLISVELDIDRILHFVFYARILQIYRQHLVRKFTDIFCQNTNKFGLSLSYLIKFLQTQWNVKCEHVHLHKPLKL